MKSRRIFDYIFDMIMCEIYHMVKENPVYPDLLESDTTIAEFAFDAAEKITAEYERLNEDGYPDVYDLIEKMAPPMIDEFYGLA